MAAPRKDDVRNIILDATEQLMASNSIDSLSLASIAKAAGISKGTLYYYYKTKDEILLGIMDRYLDTQFDDLIAWTENKEKDTSLHRLVKYVIERNTNEVGPRLHLFYNACIGNEPIRQALLNRYQKFEAVIAQKISERAGPEASDYLAWVLLLVSDGMIVQSELNNPAFDAKKFIAETENYARRIPDKSAGCTPGKAS